MEKRINNRNKRRISNINVHKKVPFPPIQMAEDALGIYLYSLKEDKEQAPEPSNPAGIETEGQDFVKLIELDADTLRPAE